MNDLYHYGIKGMRWGVRRFQNADGSYTSAGRARYNLGKNPRGGLDGDRSITGRIRNRQYDNAQKTLSDSRKALQELTDIERNASKSKIASSRISTAIRNKQKANAERDIADSKDAIRELRNISNARAEKKAARKEEVQAKAYKQDVSKNWHKAYNKATDEFNAKIGNINAKYSKEDLGYDKRTGSYNGPKAHKYFEEVGSMWTSAYKRELVSTFGEAPRKLGEDWLEKNAMFYNIYDPTRVVGRER